MINTKIDIFDTAILRELQNNGRASIIELSQIVGLSPSPVARRLHNLEEAGLLQGTRRYSMRQNWGLVFQCSCRFNSINRLTEPLPLSKPQL